MAYNKSLKVKRDGAARMPWLRLALGFIFIVNPNISIIDPLPDFIGYIIICSALSRLSMIGATLADAKRSFEKMILIDAGKLLSLIWVFAVDTSAARSSTLLLFTFGLGILEAIFLIPSYIKLFKGISDLGDYYTNTSVHSRAAGAKLSVTERMRNFSVFFVIFKVAMTLLPELSDLGNQSPVAVSLYRYIGVMRLLCAVPVLILGVIWLCRMIKYFMNIAEDEPFNRCLEELYINGVLPKQGKFVIKYVRTASWLLTVGAVLTLDLMLDGINLTPDALVSVFIGLSLVFFAKASKLKTKGITVMLVLYGLAAIATQVLEYSFAARYTYNALDSDFGAFTLYMSGTVMCAVQGVLLVCLLGIFFSQVKRVIEEHTGYVAGREINTEGERVQIAELHGELNRGFTYVVNAAMLYVLSDVTASLYGVFYSFMRKNLGVLGTVNVLCGVLFVAAVVRALGDLRYAVQTKYMLE